METAINENSSLNWQDKYIDKLSKDMDCISGMEHRLMDYIDRSFAKLDNRIDKLELRMESMDIKHNSELRDVKTNIEVLREKIEANNKHTQNLVTATIVGIGAISVGVLGVMITVVIACANIFYK